MFNWREKKADFEWHKHVRTTIKLRREDRRRRIDEAKGAAAEGLKQAGAHGAAAGRSLAVLAWNWLANLASGLIQMIGFAARRLWQGFVHIGAIAWNWLAIGTRRLIAMVRRLPPVQSLIGAGIAFAGSAYLWKLNFGANRATVVAEGIGLAAIILAGIIWAWPRWFRRMPHWLALPALPRWVALPRLGRSRNFKLMAAAAVGSVALFAAGWFAWPSLSRLEAPRMQTFGLFGGGEIRGRAAALSGDTIRIANRTIRLLSVEAPELHQTCSLRNGRSWTCGLAAKSALERLIRRATVTCQLSGTAADSLATARCSTTAGDLGALMVEQGHAFGAQGLFAASYASAEETARKRRRGIWRGKAVRPSEYRLKKWEAAKADAPGGCPIKGQLKRGKRIYVAPWSPNYASTTVRERRGERWFCSEAEALAAGWQPVGNS